MSGKAQAPPFVPENSSNVAVGNSDHQQSAPLRRFVYTEGNKNTDPQWHAASANDSSVVPPVGLVDEPIQPEAHGKCSIAVVLIFSVIQLLACFLGLSLPTYRYRGVEETDFRTRVDVFAAMLDIDGTRRRPAEYREWPIAEWPHVDPGLAAVQATMRYNTAVYGFLALFSIFLIILQLLRLCGQIRPRRLLAHFCGLGGVVLTIMLVVSTVLTFSRRHYLDEWSNRVASPYNVVGGSRSGFFAGVVIPLYLGMIPLFEFAIRTWFGAECWCCCGCDCICTLAPEAPVENTARGEEQ